MMSGRRMSKIKPKLLIESSKEMLDNMVDTLSDDGESLILGKTGESIQRGVLMNQVDDGNSTTFPLGKKKNK